MTTDLYIARLTSEQLQELIAKYFNATVTKTFAHNGEHPLSDHYNCIEGPEIAVYVKGEPYERKEWEMLKACGIEVGQ